MLALADQPTDLLKTILENVGVAIAVLDSSGNFVFANNTALTMFGTSRSAIPVHIREWSSKYRFQDSMGRDIPVESSAAMRTLAGEDVEPHELRVVFSDGQIKWLHESTHPFAVMGLTGVLVIITDETEQIELRRATAQLQRMEDVESITVGLAHNFNNILYVISTNVELALAEQRMAKKTRGRLEQINEASWKAAELVKRLMKFSRTQDMETQLIQINSLVEGVLQLVRPMLRGNVQLDEDLRPNLPEIEADRAGIEQVLVNLIVNARDAMPEGGHLSIATGLDDAQRFVTVTVTDTGIGIKEEFQTRIFDPFFTTKTAERGFGLGLSSAYAIVRQHQGEIKVSSAPGKGSKFTVRLPVQQSKEREIPSALPQSAA
jgi:two-component system cell cycle sensor histidine kinase/response regulator CckA